MFDKEDPVASAGTMQVKCEDALEYLPCTAIQEFGRGAVIYGSGASSAGLYLVLGGQVKVSYKSGKREVAEAVLGAEQLFGFWSFIQYTPPVGEWAVTMTKVKLMFWSADDLPGLIEKRPRLLLALLQGQEMVRQRLMKRLAARSAKAVVRLASLLLELAEGGVPQENGEVGIKRHTHELLSQFVGTSREIVSGCMRKLSALGLIRYSRKGCVVKPRALRDWLEQQCQ